MNLYLSGPMRGYPLLNFASFENACLVLRGASNSWGNPSHTVFSPHEHDREIGFDPTKGEDPTPAVLMNMMQWDLERVLECDAIVLLPGWQKSKGGLIELMTAVSTGKKVYEFDPSAQGGMREIPEPTLMLLHVPAIPAGPVEDIPF